MADKWKELLDHIQGSCMSLYTAIYNVYSYEYEPTHAELEELDDTYTCCDCCSWWVDSYEINEYGDCEDCQDQDQE